MITKPADPRRLLGARVKTEKICFEFCPPDIPADGDLCEDKGGLKRHMLGLLGGKLIDPAIICFLDARYFLPTPAVIRRVMFASVVSRLSGIDNRFDCDDFAFGVKGEIALYGYVNDDLLTFAPCFGVAMGLFDWKTGGHAVCFFMANDKSVYFVEPQLPRQATKPEDIVLHTVDEVRQCTFLLV